MGLDGAYGVGSMWEKALEKDKGDVDDVDDVDDTVDGTPLDYTGRIYRECFCQQLVERPFLRKLETYAYVHFNWKTFAKDFVYHTFFPFSLPLLYFLEGGTNGITNRQFWGSRMTAFQWYLSACFFLMNILTYLYISPDIVIADILWILRNMILATKYGFINKGEMTEMREVKLPMQVHKDRTLLMAWTNPLPLRVLKRELFLASIRKDQIRCTSVLRLLPGASTNAVCTVMTQFSSPSDANSEKDPSYTPTEGSGWGRYLDAEFGFNQTFRHCPECIHHDCTKNRFEDRWVNLCMAKVCKEPGTRVPKDAAFTDTDESAHASQRSDLGDQPLDRACPAVDLPALFLAAYIIQRSGDLLKKKNFLHQIYSSPWRVYWTSVFVAVIHSIIPFASRAIAGSPSTFGGSNWYHIVVSVSCFSINYSAMAASVMFMLAGTADFRRRYFTSRLLNTMLMDGWYGEDRLRPRKSQKLRQQKMLQKQSVYHLGLTVDFTDPRSMAGWWSLRSLCHDFGFVFHLRVKQYASYFAMYCALLMGFLIVELFANGTRTAIFILAVVIFDMLIFLLLLGLMVFPGGEANNANHEHGATLIRKKMLVSKQIHYVDSKKMELEPQERNVLMVTLELMQSVSQALYWDNAINKVTILGFTAGGELIAVLVGFGSAAVGIAAQQMTSKLS